ncbi:hypothetical protein [Fusibacillus kribbianus]|nr:hypothetical protein [Ruminococcus sp. YH-rum2234]
MTLNDIKEGKSPKDSEKGEQRMNYKQIRLTFSLEESKRLENNYVDSFERVMQFPTYLRFLAFRDFDKITTNPEIIEEARNRRRALKGAAKHIVYFPLEEVKIIEELANQANTSRCRVAEVLVLRGMEKNIIKGADE